MRERKREEKERQYQGNEYSHDTKKDSKVQTCRKPAPRPGTPGPPKTQFKKKERKGGKRENPPKNPHPDIHVQTKGKVCRSHSPQRPTPIKTRERRNSISPLNALKAAQPKNSQETPRREEKTVQPQCVAQYSPTRRRANHPSSPSAEGTNTP